MDRDYKKAANITVIVAGLCALAWLFFKYALGAVFPFILGAAVAGIISSPAKKLSKKTKLPRKLISALLVLIFFGIVCTVLYFAASRLILELGNLIERLSADPDVINNAISALLGKINSEESRWGLLHNMLDSDTLKNLGIDIEEMAKTAVSSITSSLAQSVSGAIMNAITNIPSLILSLIVFLLSAFYFSSDSDSASSLFMSVLPESWQNKLPHLKTKLKKTLSGYLKAYLLIMLITFLEVFVGLSILKVNYAFILAIVIAVVDILPVLGTGAILVPWSIFAFLSGNTTLGIGLLVLYGVTLIARQIIEPKIIGSTLGMHPLMTLASVYIGLKLLGFAGIFIGPIFALLLFKKDKAEENDKTKTTSVAVVDR